MITGIHGMFYSAEAEALRVFLRDTLKLPARDVGGGWLINDFTKADMGVHPIDHEGAPPSGTHQVSFTCDDIRSTVSDLAEAGVAFDDDITDQGYGLCIHFTMPGGVQVELYEPRY